ncbi:YbaK/EbsC family protein [Hahella sp. CR1]|uniref:aminoacyl-tRNA deacylase n=1 Tax=Hahella sp. CR1 TaxID=2992807 RepID=UPI00244315EC|nr:YbaK/EbsC family protein [Hahella sp. CR1]MDG9670016.1 YbaK/EbsC family protein [Hahella sp. CR1]
MSISNTLQRFLTSHNVNYEVITHPYSETSMASAQTAHVPVERMVKAVVLKDEKGYVIAAIPSTNHLNLREINQAMKRQLDLASEEELCELFGDCSAGAIPAVGEAFGMPTIWDEQLAYEPDFYLEGGDHHELVHISHYDFMEMMKSCPHGTFSAHN